MYIQERFAGYKEAIGHRFKDEAKEPRCGNWSVKNDFQKNAVQIWQHYTDWRKPNFLTRYRRWMITIVRAVCQLVLLASVVATIVGLAAGAPYTA